MKSWLWKGIFAAAVALPALGGAARAQSTDDFGCSNATLKGEYAFGVTDFGLPQVVAGIKVFDGKGNFTQRDYIGDSSPAQFAPPGQETGTYKADRDCTGSMVINLNALGVPPVTTQGGVINILFVISNGGRHIHEVVSKITPAGISRTRAHPDECRRLEGRVGAGQLRRVGRRDRAEFSGYHESRDFSTKGRR